MLLYSKVMIRASLLSLIASALLAPCVMAAGEPDWSPVRVPPGVDIVSPITHTRITSGPVRIDRTSATFKPGSRGRYLLHQVGVTNGTKNVAHKIWLYWRLYRESDLTKPAFESIFVPTLLTDVDRDISPSVSVDWLFPCDETGILLVEEGVTYRLEIGVSRVEWADGTVWQIDLPVS